MSSRKRARLQSLEDGRNFRVAVLAGGVPVNLAAEAITHVLLHADGAPSALRRIDGIVT